MLTAKQEQEFYDLCSTLYHIKHTPTEGTQLTHFVFTLIETDEEISSSTVVLNPAIPSQLNMEKAFNLSVSQHVAVLMQEPLRNLVNDLVQETMKMHHIRKGVGKKLFDKALKNSDNAKDFREALIEATKDLSPAEKLKIMFEAPGE